MRASSCIQISIGRPGCSAASVAIRRWSFSERLLRLEISLGMDWPRLLPGELAVVVQAQHAAFTVLGTEALRDQSAQVPGPLGADAIAHAVRTVQHQRTRRRRLAVVEAHRAPAKWPVAQGLAVHAGVPRRFRPDHAVQGVGKRQKAAGDAPVRLQPCLPTQRRRRHVVPNRRGCSHRLAPLPNPKRAPTTVPEFPQAG